MKWAQQAATLAEYGTAIGCGHRQVLSGSFLWCTECGSYADAKAVGLAKPCKGSPKCCNGGLWGQLRKLRRGVHPRTGEEMPQPIDEQGKLVEFKPVSTGIYANLAANRNLAGLPSPSASVHSAHAVTHAAGSDAKQKMADRLVRIRAKAAHAREAALVAAAAVAETQAGAEVKVGPKVRLSDGGGYEQPPQKARKVAGELNEADERREEPPPAKVRRRCSFKQPG